MTSAFRFGNGSSKTNSEKLGVVNDNSFWTGDDDGMAQKYTDPHAHCDSDTRRSPRAKDPAFTSQRLSPLLSTRPQHTHSSVNRALNSDRRLFFSLPYFRFVLPFPYFGFCTSAFSTCPVFAKFHCEKSL